MYVYWWIHQHVIALKQLYQKVWSPPVVPAVNMFLAFLFSSSFIVLFVSFSDFFLALSIAFPEGSQLPCCKLPYGETHMARNWKIPWANGLQRKSPSVQQSMSSWILHQLSEWTWKQITPQLSLEMTLLPDCSLVRDPEPEHPAHLCLVSQPTETGR